jgi:hypothetical protein
MHRPPLPSVNTSGTHFLYTLGRPQSHSAIGRILMSIKYTLTSAGIFWLPTYFYSDTLRTFQHTRSSYCQHHSCSQNVLRTRDIITPPHRCAFRPNTLSYTTLLQLAYTPCPHTSHCKRVQGWRTLRPTYNWVTSLTNNFVYYTYSQTQLYLTQ